MKTLVFPPIIFALVVVTQPPPTAIPAMTLTGLIVFASLLAGRGFFDCAFS